MTSHRSSVGLISRPVDGIDANPGTAYTLWTHEARHCTAPGGTQSPLLPAYGLTIALRISSWYQTEVRVPLAMSWRSVQPSKDIPPQTINDPPPNWSCLMMSQAAYCSPQRLHTLSHLSHVLSMNLLSSVKRTGHQWQTCQFWCSPANGI